MQIQLKQVEIITALKQYITSQGIDLTGKSVTIAFTAGRKESGISADLNIEEVDIPGFSEAEPTGLSLVTPVLKADEEAQPAVQEPSGELVDKVAKSVSLFN